MKILRKILIAAAAVLALTASAQQAPASHAGGNDSTVALTVGTDNVGVRAYSGGVEITVDSDRPCNVEVYAITGRLVKSITAEQGKTSIDLPPGCYVVKAGNTTRRVAVK